MQRDLRSGDDGWHRATRGRATGAVETDSGIDAGAWLRSTYTLLASSGPCSTRRRTHRGGALHCREERRCRWR